MLTIGEFSALCRVSAKALRYYAKIGLLLPAEINPENGYRYYSISQLKTVLLIHRFKMYHFSLEEIKAMLPALENQKDGICDSLLQKEAELKNQLRKLNHTLQQLHQDIRRLQNGKSVFPDCHALSLQTVSVPPMRLLCIRKMIQEETVSKEYAQSFDQLLHTIEDHHLTQLAPPMVLFHSSEWGPAGFDMEFAIPILEPAANARIFSPGLCLQTILRGSYSSLPVVYARHREWAEQEGYEITQCPYEIYITDPSQVSDEQHLITEIYSPIQKKS